MEEKRKIVGRYYQAISCLPPRLMGEAMSLPGHLCERAEEIRLQCGQPLAIVCEGQLVPVKGEPVETAELRELLSRAARYSVHSYGEDLSRGFLPLEGGHRLGLCGTVAYSSGEIVGYRSISSVCIRVARAIPHAAESIADAVCDRTGCKSTLVIAPPGLGKTTLLRDLIRRCSLHGLRVGVADERSELAALSNGRPQFDLGPCIDVIEGTDKAEAAMRLIRTMSPRVLAMDEITEDRDLHAIDTAAHCGVAVLATAHGLDAADLMRKPLFAELFRQCVFEQTLTITRRGGERILTVEGVPC